jgi:catechol 2,3-dioxygenase-like lactoylglutathione lyase family enzyme
LIAARRGVNSFRPSHAGEIMDKVISDLVTNFDAGTLSRRQLIQGLTVLAAAGAAAPAAAQTTPFTATRIDHISIQTSNLQRSIEFYQKIFGLKVLSEDKENEISRMGATKIIVSLHHKQPFAAVDHFAIAIDGFDRDATTKALAAHGYKAEQNLDYGFFVRDPEGMPVQIVPT